MPANFSQGLRPDHFAESDGSAPVKPISTSRFRRGSQDNSRGLPSRGGADRFQGAGEAALPGKADAPRRSIDGIGVEIPAGVGQKLEGQCRCDAL